MSARNLMLGVGLAAMLGGVFCAQAQTALPAGSGQLLLAPRAGDARPPLPFGLSGKQSLCPRRPTSGIRPSSSIARPLLYLCNPSQCVRQPVAWKSLFPFVR